jgi:hypothetical protein
MLEDLKLSFVNNVIMCKGKPTELNHYNYKQRLVNFPDVTLAEKDQIHFCTLSVTK